MVNKSQEKRLGEERMEERKVVIEERESTAQQYRMWHYNDRII